MNKYSKKKTPQRKISKKKGPKRKMSKKESNKRKIYKNNKNNKNINTKKRNMKGGMNPDQGSTIELRTQYEVPIYEKDMKNIKKTKEDIQTKTNVKLNFNDDVLEIPNDAFSGCIGITELNLPDNLTSIGNNSFSGCEGITKLKLPRYLTRINQGTFSGCVGITELNLPDYLTSIGNNAFSGCTGITELNLPYNLTYIGQDVFNGCTGITDLKLSNNLESIGKNAFYGCTGIPKLKLPKSLESIGEAAFSRCIKITELKLPNSLKSIGQGAFSNCSELQKIDLSQCTRRISFKPDAFQQIKSDITIILPIDITLNIKYLNFINPTVFPNINSININYNYNKDNTPDVLKKKKEESIRTKIKEKFNNPEIQINFQDNPISKYEFETTTTKDGKEFTTLKINEGVFEIYYRDFEDLINKNKLKLTHKIIFPTSLETIGNDTFSQYTDIAEINFPEKLKTIGIGAFASCHKITEITFPRLLERIGKDAFHDCRNLKRINMKDCSGEIVIGETPFKDCTNIISITLPNLDQDKIQSFIEKIVDQINSEKEITIYHQQETLNDNEKIYIESLKYKNIIIEHIK